ncbi:lipid-A-disaccharide synthase [Marivivens niveibacter]|uniref:Lipid-A-disaccharide synthase n=1 Tax=Marivivens niveibacter TaxID=1930667 RepID=A0A251WUN4_9RHOB|nr:lipid-A-disaccharide synthase [Marivivens niveibacter]OUD08199.1 lipid-A-disaccharide synthase [Marivivens niveibacter]
MKIFVLAGEPSGDRLGGALMAGLRELRPDVEFIGVGGPIMQSHGLDSLFPMEELSIMGLAEILPKYFHLKRRIGQTAGFIAAEKPDVVITIDAPDFSLRVAKLVKDLTNIRTIHYVAPSVWAWRPKRAERMAHMIDHVLALLPFEPPLMTAHGMDCDFVGHPVVGERQATAEEAAAFRAAYGIDDAPLILALPGSRKGEVNRLSDRFGAALAGVLQARPDARVVLPCAASVVDLVKEKTAQWSFDPILIDPATAGPMDKLAAFRAADVALAASGTVSLELAAAQTPMVIAYDFTWITWQIMKRMALIDTVTLVNLVSDTRVVPEFLGPDCLPDKMTPAILDVLDHPERQLEALNLTMERLGKGGEAPGLRAARAVLDRL